MTKRLAILAIASESDDAVDIIKVETPSVLMDPDKIIENDFMALTEKDCELNNMSDTIEEAASVMSTIDGIQERFQEAVDSGEGVSPQVSEAVSLAIEHFKKRLSLSTPRTLPSMESFGGKMSKVAATKVAMEEMAGLADSISGAIASSNYSWFDKFKELLEDISNVRTKLTVRLNEAKGMIVPTDENHLHLASVHANAWSKLICNYNHVVNDEIISPDRLLEQLREVKATLSSDYYAQYLDKVISKLGNCEEDLLGSFAGLEFFLKDFVDLYRGLMQVEEYKPDFGFSKTMIYPTNGDKIITGYNLSDSGYFYSSVEVSEQVIPEGVVMRLCCLSEAQSKALLEECESILSEKELIGKFNKINDLFVVLSTAVKTMIADNKILDEEKINKLQKRIDCIETILQDILRFITKMVNRELKVINAICDYIASNKSELTNALAADKAEQDRRVVV
jgi:hypothetical protein